MRYKNSDRDSAEFKRKSNSAGETPRASPALLVTALILVQPKPVKIV